MNARSIARCVMVSCFLLPPAAAWAQANAAIAGVVKDTSGAVMPGVTVEATSPALIEKVRTGITDDQGQYKIVDLRPGTYVVTFSLPGFSTVKREGLELTTAFTTTVNADLKVGSLEETVTVSGAAPVVDTQNVIQQQTMRAAPWTRSRPRDAAARTPRSCPGRSAPPPRRMSAARKEKAALRSRSTADARPTSTSIARVSTRRSSPRSPTASIPRTPRRSSWRRAASPPRASQPAFW